MSYWNAGFVPAAFQQPPPQPVRPYPAAQQQQRGFFQPTPPESPLASPNAFKSGSKYASLHPILAYDTTLLRFDVTKRPNSEIMPQIYYTHGRSQATWSGANHIRLISKHFPWSIDIKLPSPVTCEIVWEALYSALQQPIADSEWGLIAGDKKQRETIEKAAKKRSEEDGKTELLRADWLGETVLWRGLEKNEDFERARLMPGSDHCAETWVVRLCN